MDSSTAAPYNRSKKLPGDPSLEQLVARMIRVNQAGEYGAVRIYQGQLAVLGKSAAAETIEHMLVQEQSHLDKFNQMIVKRRVRPTLLSPLWYVAGYALGAGTALLGEKAAMACTVAVEEVIDEHYAKQEDLLNKDEKELKALISKCREEEQQHKETGIAHGAREAVGYPILTAAIKTGSRLAIWLSTRI